MERDQCNSTTTRCSFPGAPPAPRGSSKPGAHSWNCLRCLTAHAALNGGEGALAISVRALDTWRETRHKWPPSAKDGYCLAGDDKWKKVPTQKQSLPPTPPILACYCFQRTKTFHVQLMVQTCRCAPKPTKTSVPTGGHVPHASTSQSSGFILITALSGTYSALHCIYGGD